VKTPFGPVVATARAGGSELPEHGLKFTPSVIVGMTPSFGIRTRALFTGYRPAGSRMVPTSWVVVPPSQAAT
jgi:hypothetical protein